MNILYNKTQIKYSLPLKNKLYEVNVNQNSIYIEDIKLADLKALRPLKQKVKNDLNEKLKDIETFEIRFNHKNRFIRTLIRLTGH